jgi:hypothetical protein
MKVILLLTVLGTTLIAVGLLGLYVNVTMRLKEIENDIHDIKKKSSRNRERIRILEDRAADQSDHVIITHKWDEVSGIRYPSQEV